MIDRFDEKILSLLQHDGRMSWVDLAEAVALSPSACQRRVRALEDQGVIRGFSALVDPQALGYQVEAFVSVNVERHNVELAREFRDAIEEFAEVRRCHILSGDVDFLLQVVVRDLPALGAFIQQKLLNLPGIKDAASAIVLERVKDGGVLPIAAEDEGARL